MSAVEELLNKLLRPARLLFVEKDSKRVDALRRQIQEHYECSVDCAESGDEAKHKLGQNKYDLLLLEAGPQPAPFGALLRHVKRTLPSMPVVIVTETPAAVEEAATCGVVGVLAKPVCQADIDDLFRVFKIRVRSRDYVPSGPEPLSRLAAHPA